jgi:hypothetical protein
VLAELEAVASLGGAHETVGHTAAAIRSFERQAALAETSADEGYGLPLISLLATSSTRIVHSRFSSGLRV